MKKKELKALALEQMEKHGLTHQGWRFEFTNRRSEYGECNGMAKIISLSWTALRGMKTEWFYLDTIIHEIAHAIVGCREGHGHIWRAKYIELGGRQG